jgi:hypothetical protein
VNIGVKSGRYLYGVIRSDSGLAPPKDGVAGASSTFTVVHGGIAALVSEVDPAGFAPKKNDLLAHANVLEQAALVTDVLPWRFGTIFEGDRELVSELLAPKERALLRSLEDLSGVVELQVKVSYVEDEVLREITLSDPTVKRLKARGAKGYQDQVRLGEAVARALEKRRTADAKAIGSCLHRLAESCSTGPLNSETMVANLACLVRRDAIERFEREVETMAQGSSERMTFRVLGPLPPYSFVDPAALAVA